MWGEVSIRERLRLYATLDTPPSIHIKIDTCDELCIGTGKKNCRGSDIINFTNTPHRNVGDEVLSIGWGIRNASEVREKSSTGN